MCFPFEEDERSKMGTCPKLKVAESSQGSNSTVLLDNFFSCKLNSHMTKPWDLVIPYNILS